MANQIHRSSAEIIPFRPRDASTNGGGRYEVKKASDTKDKQVKVSVCFDSWYHEAEIISESRLVKN